MKSRDGQDNTYLTYLREHDENLARRSCLSWSSGDLCRHPSSHGLCFGTMACGMYRGRSQADEEVKKPPVEEHVVEVIFKGSLLDSEIIHGEHCWWVSDSYDKFAIGSLDLVPVVILNMDSVKMLRFSKRGRTQ